MLKNVLQQNGDSSSLVVLLHGYNENPQILAGVIEEIQTHHPNADLLRPFYQKGRFLNGDPFQVADHLEATIRDTYENSKREGRPYNKIILIGYSFGALLIRKAYVYGMGSEEDRHGSPGNTPPNEWTDRVERILLLAGVNRGWSLDVRPRFMSLSRFILYRYLLYPLAQILRVGRFLTRLERGSPFVANLRLQWVRLVQRERERVAPVVQLMGTVDSLVTAADDADLYVHKDFIFIPVEGADHTSLIQFDDGELGQRCKNRFVEALTAPIPDLRRDYEEQQHILQEGLDAREKHIVFILHGIRDYGGWTNDLGEELERVATRLKLPQPKVVTAKYDFFPMSRFLMSRLLLRTRQRYVRWFMDQYTEQIAKFPSLTSKVSFIGHSNGTYLLASALQQYRTVKIHRASFAGSVVPREYPWEQIITQERRVDALRNDLAAGDWAVAIFPKFFDQFNLSDVGSGGFDGFLDDAANELEGRYYKGSHGAAIQRANFESLATFILTGKVERDQTLLTDSQVGWIWFLSRISIVAWLLVLALAVFLLWVSFSLGGYPGAVIFILIVLLITNFV